jgi:hypothetical protein
MSSAADRLSKLDVLPGQIISAPVQKMSEGWESVGPGIWQPGATACSALAAFQKDHGEEIRNQLLAIVRHLEQFQSNETAESRTLGR